MDTDQIASAQREERRLAFIKLIKDNRDTILKTVEEYSTVPSERCIVAASGHGSYNYCMKLRLNGGQVRWVLRFPLASELYNVKEKHATEVAVMKFISAKCSNIPIPKIIAHGLWGPGPLEGHPFMLIEELPGQSMRTIWDRVMASKALREKVFGQLAGIQIQLSRFRFKEIGSPLLKEHEALEVWGQRLANCLYVRFV